VCPGRDAWKQHQSDVVYLALYTIGFYELRTEQLPQWIYQRIAYGDGTHNFCVGDWVKDILQITRDDAPDVLDCLRDDNGRNGDPDQATRTALRILQVDKVGSNIDKVCGAMCIHVDLHTYPSTKKKLLCVCVSPMPARQVVRNAVSLLDQTSEDWRHELVEAAVHVVERQVLDEKVWSRVLSKMGSQWTKEKRRRYRDDHPTTDSPTRRGGGGGFGDGGGGGLFGRRRRGHHHHHSSSSSPSPAAHRRRWRDTPTPESSSSGRRGRNRDRSWSPPSPPTGTGDGSPMTVGQGPCGLWDPWP
jgi:hypothetical protein